MLDYTSYETKLPYTNPKKDRDAFQAYTADVSRLRENFKRDALEEVGLLGHPKADKAFDFAWSQGHSDGFSGVFGHLRNIADVLL